jgi:organic radical activating enzyme
MALVLECSALTGLALIFMLMKDQIDICEMYPTLQGEGTHAGESAVLLRLFGGNLNGRNDHHPYAQDRTALHWEENLRRMDIDKVAKLITEVTQADTFHWIVTGGEPLLQQDALVKLILSFEEQYGKKPFVELETNGTITPSETLDPLVGRYNVTIHLSNSMEGSSRDTFDKRISAPAMKFFVGKENVDFLFEVQNDNDLKEVYEISNIFKLPKKQVWLKPTEWNEKVAPVVFQMCVRNKLRLSSRLHLSVFKGRRGF